MKNKIKLSLSYVIVIFAISQLHWTLFNKEPIIYNCKVKSTLKNEDAKQKLMSDKYITYLKYDDNKRYRMQEIYNIKKNKSGLLFIWEKDTLSIKKTIYEISE